MEIVTYTPPTNLEAIEAAAKDRYAEALLLASQAKHNARESLNALAECGSLLMLGKEQVVNRPEWILSLGIPLDHADKAVFLYRNREQLLLDLWPSDVARVGLQFAELLPPPGSANRETNDPERTTGPSRLWLAHAGKLHKSLLDLTTAKPVSDWRDDEKENLRIALEPIMKIYRELE